jgi:phosphoglycerol transferase
MDSDYCDDIDEEYERKVIYSIYQSGGRTSKKGMERVFFYMDDFPRTLGALGVDIEGNRLGLGVNLSLRRRHCWRHMEKNI